MAKRKRKIEFGMTDADHARIYQYGLERAELAAKRSLLKDKSCKERMNALVIANHQYGYAVGHGLSVEGIGKNKVYKDRAVKLNSRANRVETMLKRSSLALFDKCVVGS